ncbi:NAD(P)-binding protein [Chloroflexota bacterium]
MKKDFDVIILGGGPGGLAIGCLLAKEGLKSAIIEKAPVLGGRYRSVDFHGCRVDCATHFIVSLVGSAEETNIHKLFSHLGLPLEYKLVPWPVGKVTQEKPGKMEILEMDPKLGLDNLFSFFAFIVGMDMADSTKKEVLGAVNSLADISEDECRKLVNVSFSDWINRSVEDPLAQSILDGFMSIGSHIPAKDVSLGYLASSFPFWVKSGITQLYPKHGTLETAFIAPMAKYYTDHGGKVITNRTARSITIENGRAEGVVVSDDQNCFVLEEYNAPVVICAIPIFEAVASNILSSEHLTRDWADAIRLLAEQAVYDLTGFYLLQEDVIPRDGYGYIHILDTDYGMPTDVGHLCLGSFVNVINEPQGKQLACSCIYGSLDATHFGIPSRMEKVREANRRFKEGMEKAYPGFNKAIEFEGMNLLLNNTRYAMARVPTEIDIQSPNIQGLYFAGDSIRTVCTEGTQMSDKCCQMAFPLRERIMNYLGS